MHLLDSPQIFCPPQEQLQIADGLWMRFLLKLSCSDLIHDLYFSKLLWKWTILSRSLLQSGSMKSRLSAGRVCLKKDVSITCEGDS